jgi:type I restriction enzyme S subunit
LFFVLQSPSVKSFFEREATGTTILNLSLASIGRFSFSLPPLAEQSQISSFLSASTSEVDELIDRVKQEIALIKEYRTRLTADVVTGQLDVRAAASQLPDEADEAAATNAGVLPPCDEDEMPDDEIEDA